MQERAAQLCTLPLFAGIAPQELTAMLKCVGGYEKTHHKGEFILFSGEPVPCVGVVLRGTIHMLKEDPWGDKAIFAVMRRGELFGESFACGSAMAATVSFYVAAESKVLYLPFERVLNTCPTVCPFHQRLLRNLVQRLADKNVHLMEKLEVVSKKTLRSKILTYLCIEAERQGSRSIELPLGRVDMAEYLCADRSALTRELTNMQADGLIEFHKNHFVLKKLEK